MKHFTKQAYKAIGLALGAFLALAIFTGCPEDKKDSKKEEQPQVLTQAPETNSTPVAAEPVAAEPAEETKPVEETKKEEPKEKEYFNTISSGADQQESDPWKNFFGLMGDSGGYSSDPIVELASALFAGLMAMAIQIDGMGNAQEVQQTPALSPSESPANALASKNFDEAMNSMNNNPIKRTRS